MLFVELGVTVHIIIKPLEVPVCASTFKEPRETLSYFGWSVVS